jgi:hypothetical protein
MGGWRTGVSGWLARHFHRMHARKWQQQIEPIPLQNRNLIGSVAARAKKVARP